jgi:hypothetical protein
MQQHVLWRKKKNGNPPGRARPLSAYVVEQKFGWLSFDCPEVITRKSGTCRTGPLPAQPSRLAARVIRVAVIPYIGELTINYFRDWISARASCACEGLSQLARSDRLESSRFAPLTAGRPSVARWRPCGRLLDSGRQAGGSLRDSFFDGRSWLNLRRAIRPGAALFTITTLPALVWLPHLQPQFNLSLATEPNGGL